MKEVLIKINKSKMEEKKRKIPAVTRLIRKTVPIKKASK
jgi:hypothetical protein